MTWSAIGSGFEEAGDTSQQRNSEEYPPTWALYILENHICDRYSLVFLTGKKKLLALLFFKTTKVILDYNSCVILGKLYILFL